MKKQGTLESDTEEAMVFSERSIAMKRMVYGSPIILEGLMGEFCGGEIYTGAGWILWRRAREHHRGKGDGGGGSCGAFHWRSCPDDARGNWSAR